MAGILANIGLVVTKCISWVSDWLGCITAEGNEILYIMLLLPLVGIGVGFIKRLVRI